MEEKGRVDDTLTASDELMCTCGSDGRDGARTDVAGLTYRHLWASWAAEYSLVSDLVDMRRAFNHGMGVAIEYQEEQGHLLVRVRGAMGTKRAASMLFDDREYRGIMD